MQVLYTHGVGVARFAYLAAAGKHGEIALVNRAGIERAFRGVGEQRVRRFLDESHGRQNAPVKRELVIDLFGGGGGDYNAFGTES